MIEYSCWYIVEPRSVIVNLFLINSSNSIFGIFVTILLPYLLLYYFKVIQIVILFHMSCLMEILDSGLRSYG